MHRDVMKPAFMTGTFFETNLFQHLDRIQEIGYDTLEIWCYEPHFYYQSQDHVQRVKKELDRRKLKVHSLHATFHGLLDLSGLDDCDRIHALETVKKQARITSYLGAQIIVVHPGAKNVPRSERKIRIGYFLEALNQLIPVCKCLGLKIAVENMGPDYLGDKIEEIARIVNSYEKDIVGICLDTSHANLTGDLFNYLDRLGDRIITFHISDNNGIHDDHLPPGQGQINWPKFLKGVEKIGYKGPLVMEILDKESNDLYESIRTAKENLEYFLKFEQETNLPLLNFNKTKPSRQKR